jgi:hypothetical protein
MKRAWAPTTESFEEQIDDWFPPTLQRLNLIEIETRWGYKAFELYQGNVIDISQPVDLLVVSALSRDLKILGRDSEMYDRIKHTLIGALHGQAGVDVAALREASEFDLLSALGCWVSTPIESAVCRRVLCVENIGLSRSTEQAFDNVFVTLSLLEAKGIVVETLLLPLLGTGAFIMPVEEAIRSALDAAQRHLPRLQHLRRVLFFELSVPKAAQLNEAMNRVLGRANVALSASGLADSVRGETLEALDALSASLFDRNQQVIGDLKRVIARQESRSFEIAIVGRRLVESIVNDLSGDSSARPLFKKIDTLSNQGIADWIRSYMHTVRIFGNESAHERSREGRFPESLGEHDVVICLFCIQRLIRFWSDYTLARSREASS